MDPKAIDYICDLASERGDAFELIAADANVLSVEYDKGKLKEIEQKGSTGAGIRIARDGNLGFAVTSKLEDGGEMVESAARLAPFGTPYDYGFAPEAKSETPEFYDASVGELNTDRLLELGDYAQNKMRELAPDAKFQGSVDLQTSKSVIRTSEGQNVEENSSVMSIFVGAEIVEEGNFFSAYAYDCANGIISEANCDRVVEEAAEVFNAARTSAACPAGSYRMLISPKCLGDFLRPVNVNVNGLNVEKGISRWIESRGQQVFDNRITLWDDPSLKEGIGSSAYDGEGTPTAKRALIENGVLKNFVHSRSTAAHTGEEPTGNGARGVSSTAQPGMHNFVMDGGNDELSALIQQANGGLWVESLIGVFTSNFLAGQVSGQIMTGFKVEDGQRAGRVKNVAFNVNAFDLFGEGGRILGISKERKWVGSTLLPWVLVEGVPISAR